MRGKCVLEKFFIRAPAVQKKRKIIAFIIQNFIANGEVFALPSDISQCQNPPFVPFLYKSSYYNTSNFKNVGAESAKIMPLFFAHKFIKKEEKNV